MKITINNLKDLTIGQEIWITNGIHIPDRLIYVGKFGSQYHFTNGIIARNIYASTLASNVKNMFTTNQEANERLRELLIFQIEHYNTHQLKDNPILLK